MSIKKSEKCWRGTEFADLVKYLKGYEPGGYAVWKVHQSVCACGSTQFILHVDQDEELSKRTCARCRKVTFIADSKEFWTDASPKKTKCPFCKNDVYEVGISLALGESKDWVRWMGVGIRCIKCGCLGSPVDWKADYDLKDPVLKNI